MANLGQFGFQTSGVLRRFGSSAEVSVSNGRVAVAFDVSKQGAGVCPEFPVHMVVFDGKTGGVIAHRSWPATVPEFSLGATDKGNFLLLVENYSCESSDLSPSTLLLLSPDLHEIKRMELQGDRTGAWSITVSQSGESVLLSRRRGKLCEHQLADAETLTPRQHWTDSVSVNGGISQRYAVSFGAGHPKDMGPVIASPLDDHWNTVAGLNGAAKPFGTSAITGIGATPDTLSVVTPYGQVLFSHTYSVPKGKVELHPAGTSADGNEIACVVVSMSNRWFVRPRIFVYVFRPPDARPVLIVETHKLDWLDTQAGLSGDGATLAVVADGRIQMFELPSAP